MHRSVMVQKIRVGQAHLEIGLVFWKGLLEEHGCPGFSGKEPVEWMESLKAPALQKILNDVEQISTLDYPAKCAWLERHQPLRRRS